MTKQGFLPQTSWRYIFRLSFTLGFEDIRGMYRRTILGQFWITLAMLIMVGAIATVFGLLFKTPLDTYLPYLLTGLIFWNLLTGIITDGSNAFNMSAPYIQQHAAPKIIYFMRSLWKQLLLLAHNIVVLPLILPFFLHSYSWGMLLFIPGFIIGFVAVSSFGLVFAFLATRFRDIPQMISAVLLVLFYVTPVIWDPARLDNRIVEIVVAINPLASVLQIMRLPLLNVMPDPKDWLIAGAWAVIFGLIAWATYKKFHNKLSYWV